MALKAIRVRKVEFAAGKVCIMWFGITCRKEGYETKGEEKEIAGVTEWGEGVFLGCRGTSYKACNRFDS